MQFLGVTITTVLISPANAYAIYFNDFESGETTGWNTSTVGTTANGSFLGYYNNNENISLTLNNVEAGDYNINFDFFAIMTWDGQGISPGCCGPDYFKFLINGEYFVDATFGGAFQSYSDDTPLGDGGLFSGSTDVDGYNVLGLTRPDGKIAVDKQYSMEFSYSHAGGDMILQFIGDTSQAGSNYYNSGFADEPWAIDNVSVSTLDASVPEPATILLLGTGLFGLAILRKKNKK